MNNSKKLLKSSYFFVIHFLIFVILIFIVQLQQFKNINNLVLDQLQGNISARSEIIIIAIDDKSLQAIGAWPWDRSVFAQALNNLQQAKPRVAALDVLFLESRSGDDQLQNIVTNTTFPIVFASKLISSTDLASTKSSPSDTDSLETVLKSSYHGEKIKSGYVNFDTDDDGKIRSTSVNKNISANNTEKSFAYQTFQSYLGNGVSSNFDKQTFSQDISSYLFNYTKDNFTQISFVDIYNGNFNKSDLKDKILLVGSTSVDLKNNLNDNFTDIFGKSLPGINIHANIVNSLLQNKFQTTINFTLFVIILYSISLVLAILFRKIKRNLFDVLILIGVLIVMNLISILLFEFGINWNFVLTNIVIIGTYIFCLAFKFFVERKENTFIQKAFSQYINPKLLKQIMLSPELLKLGGDKRNMTVLFSDIRGFTTLSEKMNPEELISLLNQYLERMCKIILKNNGTIDKFIGDAIMAFWNAPLDDEKHQINAIKTGIEMEAELDKFNAEHPEYDDLHIGIGLNTGEMVVGNVGSDDRFDYTVLGDDVNLGSRIEGLTKKYGVSILATENVIHEIDLGDEIILRLIDEVIVKGKSKPIKIFQPLMNSEENIELKKNYEHAFELYQNGKFEEAVKFFEKNTEDKTSTIMIERISAMDKDNWHGVWKWEEK